MPVDNQLIAQHWNGIGAQQNEMVRAFYERFFERHPKYRKLFPESHSRQMDSMVDTLALIAKGAHLPELFQPHIDKISERHAGFGLDADAYYRFISVLLEVLGEYNTAAWSPECEAAWGEALEQFILPHLTHHPAVGG